jgi:phosphatidylinositol glycan class N
MVYDICRRTQMLSLRKKTVSNSLSRYDRFLIRAIVMVAYLGWAAYAALFVFRPQDITPSAVSHRPSIATVILILVMLIFWASFAVQKSPWTFYVYVTFPCYFWNQVILHAAHPVRSWIRERRFVSYGRSLLQASLVTGILQSMVVRIHQL